MILNITQPDAIRAELEDIDGFLTITCSEEIEEVVERGNRLAVYIARSGKLLADAKYHLNREMQAEAMKALATVAKQAGSTAKATNAIIDSLCRDEQYVVDWSDRVNRAATHQLDWCRTLVSKAKAEMSIQPRY